MLAVSLNPNAPNPALVEIAELPRPEIKQPSDAILLVTTAAIGPWEIERARRSENGPTPGAQFAGIVVGTGAGVSSVNIDDLVVAMAAPSGNLFGAGSLGGGHAEYVRVPNADASLVKTTAAAEERTVFAGGSAALGIAIAEVAFDRGHQGSVFVLGCDAITLSALAWLRHRRGRAGTGAALAFDNHPARLAAAKVFGAEVVEADALPGLAVQTVIIGSGLPPATLAKSVAALKPGGRFIKSDPAATLPALPPGRDLISVAWPGIELAMRAEMAIRLRQIDLTALVSTVVPLDEAAEGYRVALEAPPGTRSVLLKP